MLINLKNTTFGYDAENIFENVNLSINLKDRIGLIGTNGAGKTTLLKLILGELSPNIGEISKKSNLSMACLKQNTGLNSEKSVYDEMNSVFDSVHNALREKEQIAFELSKHQDSSKEFSVCAQKLAEIDSFLYAKDAFNVDVKIKTILNGMGFQNCYSQIVSTMSGGEKTRLALCKLLLEEPELLILDEPTNHLDFQTLQWLETYLSTYKGAILIVSHDRYFLDNMVSKIWELEDKEISSYTGNYSKFRQTKKEIVACRQKEFQKQSEKISAMKEYAEKNIVRATTSKSAKSRLHQLENIEILEKPKTFHKTAKFKFSMDYESNKIVLTVENASLQIENKVLLSDASFQVKRQERVAIIGANGAGKSTLLKEILSRKNRAIRFGKDVKTAYYDQENLNLDFNNTVIDELWGKFRGKTQTEVRSILGGLLLDENDIQKQIKVLSGGERAKLGFALIMADTANTLILDEPTNHLDLETREALEEGLKNFDGTIIFVSHDRYFLNQIATKIVEIENKTIKEFVGNFVQYEKQKKLENEQKLELALEQQIAKPISKSNSYFRSAKDRSQEIKQKQHLQNLEKRIEELSKKEAELFEELAKPSCYENFKTTNEMQREIRKEIDTLEEEWMSLVD